MEHATPNKGRKTKPPQVIKLNGTIYREDSKCPACSGERDTGGRLEFRKRKNWFLKCRKCKYAVHSDRVKLQQEKWRKKKFDRKIVILQSTHRKKKKLKITKAVAKEIKRLRAEQKAKRELEKIDDLSWIK